MDFNKITNKNFIIGEEIKRNEPKYFEIKSLNSIKGDKAPKIFENSVYNYFLENKSKHKIESIYNLRNSYIDGYLLSENGIGISIEIKYRLNWGKSNIARSQIYNFNYENIYTKLNLPEPKIGIIIFGNFSGDWNSTSNNRTYKNGWHRFYQEQNNFDEIAKIHILQFVGNLFFNPGI